MPQLIRHSLVGAVCLAALAACTPQAQDRLARDAARAAITSVVVDRFPGVPVEPTINCIIDNASAAQIRALAADTVLGPTESTVQIVGDILRRPETIQCLAGWGLSALARRPQV